MYINLDKYLVKSKYGAIDHAIKHLCGLDWWLQREPTVTTWLAFGSQPKPYHNTSVKWRAYKKHILYFLLFPTFHFYTLIPIIQTLANKYVNMKWIGEK